MRHRLQKKKITITELYERCVGEGGMSPDYFARTLTLYEAQAFCRGLERRKHVAWETARYIAYFSAMPHLKNFSFEKMPKFSWEEEDVTEQPPTDEEFANLRAAAAAMEKRLNKKVNNGNG